MPQTLRSWRAPCSAPGCRQLTRSTYGKYCERHRQRVRRTGDPAMKRRVTVYELRPYLVTVRRIIRAKHREVIEQWLRDVQQSFGHGCRSALAERLASTIRGPRWKLQALADVARVTAEANPIRAGEVVAACHLLRSQEPHRFPSDRAFVFSLVARWRKLATVAYGSYWNQQRERRVSTYRDPSPRVIEALGELLSACYAPFVGRMLLAVAREREASQRMGQKLDAALCAASLAGDGPVDA